MGKFACVWRKKCEKYVMKVCVECYRRAGGEKSTLAKKESGVNRYVEVKTEGKRKEGKYVRKDKLVECWRKLQVYEGVE